MGDDEVTQIGRTTDGFIIMSSNCVLYGDSSHPMLQTRSREPSLAKLVDLPLEVLVEILVLLEWKDILRLRQTCQRLRHASLSRPVWLSLVQWYSATVQPRPFLPEKPLKLYTARELEYLILKWQSGKTGRPLTQPRELALSIPEDFLQSANLIQGGRWLLFGARDGSVKYHDLNAPGETSQAITLVSSHFDQDANTRARLSVDMDLDAEYTTFNLAIMSSRLPSRDNIDDPHNDPDYPNAPRYVRWIEVSRVTSYWDESGRVLGLRAERLACFPEVYLGVCETFTLRGRHVAYSMYSIESRHLGDGENIAIVDWSSADPDSLAYPRRLFWRRRPQWLALLPDDKLLCYMSPEFLLFDLKDAAMTTLLPTQQNQPPSQEPAVSFRLWVNAISPPYRVHDSIRFSVLTVEGGVEGLIISHASRNPRMIDRVDLLSYYPNSSSSAQMGYERALLRFPDTVMLRYVWPEANSSAVVSQAIQMPGSERLFDEYSSRVVAAVGSVVKCILDLAAI